MQTCHSHMQKIYKKQLAKQTLYFIKEEFKINYGITCLAEILLKLFLKGLEFKINYGITCLAEILLKLFLKGLVQRIFFTAGIYRLGHKYMVHFSKFFSKTFKIKF